MVKVNRPTSNPPSGGTGTKGSGKEFYLAMGVLAILLIGAGLSPLGSGFLKAFSESGNQKDGNQINFGDSGSDGSQARLGGSNDPAGNGSSSDAKGEATDSKDASDLPYNPGKYVNGALVVDLKEGSGPLKRWGVLIPKNEIPSLIRLSTSNIHIRDLKIDQDGRLVGTIENMGAKVTGARVVIDLFDSEGNNAGGANRLETIKDDGNIEYVPIEFEAGQKMQFRSKQTFDIAKVSYIRPRVDSYIVN